FQATTKMRAAAKTWMTRVLGSRYCMPRTTAIPHRPRKPTMRTSTSAWGESAKARRARTGREELNAARGEAVGTGSIFGSKRRVELKGRSSAKGGHRGRGGHADSHQL